MRGRRIVLSFLICMLFLSGCGTSAAAGESQEALKEKGINLALQGDYEGAIASYNEALQLSGLMPGALERDIAAYKASALFYDGRPEEAIETCTAILDLKDSAELYLTRGLIYKSAGNEENANQDFQEALKLLPSKDYLTRGRLYFYMGDYTQARENLEQADQEGNAEALYWQAQMYWQMGNTDYAVSLFENYAGEGIGHPEVYVKLAAYRMEQGDMDTALSMVEAGLESGGSNVRQELLACEIAIYEEKRDFQTAKEKMENYLAEYPEDEEASREYTFLKTR